MQVFGYEQFSKRGNVAMDDLQEKRCRCKLCGAIFKDSDMSEEHYPARVLVMMILLHSILSKCLNRCGPQKYILKLKKG